jgi:hypothetical protein
MPETIKRKRRTEYRIEFSNGAFWEDLHCFYDLELAIKELQNLRECLPNVPHRLIKSEWEVIEI